MLHAQILQGDSPDSLQKDHPSLQHYFLTL